MEGVSEGIHPLSVTGKFRRNIFANKKAGHILFLSGIDGRNGVFLAAL